MNELWPERLRRARLALALSQASLARAAGVSTDTVRACEWGRRRPSRNVLEALLTALKLDRPEANQIRNALGYAANHLLLGERDPAFMFSIPELPAWMERLPWPQFVADENLQIVAANTAAQAVWQVDIEREYPNIHDRSITKFAADPRFADCLLNWEELVSYGVAIWKGHHLGAESLESPSPFFDTILKELARGDPRYLGRFLDVWQKTEGKTPKVRDRYRVAWQAPGFQPINFICLTSSANEWEGLAFNDWVPIDTKSWAALEAMKASRDKDTK